MIFNIFCFMIFIIFYFLSLSLFSCILNYYWLSFIYYYRFWNRIRLIYFCFFFFFFYYISVFISISCINNIISSSCCFRYSNFFCLLRRRIWTIAFYFLFILPFIGIWIYRNCGAWFTSFIICRNNYLWFFFCFLCYIIFIITWRC